MSDFIEVGRFEPTQDTRMGRMLAAGRLTSTVTFKVGGQDVNAGEHITVSFSSRLKDKAAGTTKKSGFAEASHVYVSMGDGSYGSQYLGCYYPRTGKFYPQHGADKARIAAVLFTLRAARDGQQDREKVSIQEASRCGRCARELTDPESIARGLGPECYGLETGSKHQVRRVSDNSLIANVPAGYQPVKEVATPSISNPLPETFEQLTATL